MKVRFGVFQGVIFMLMSSNYHANIYRTHFQTFNHCHTSVVTVVAKFIFTIAFVIKKLSR